ncbi:MULTISPECIES: TonB-dependent siderophore receptor [Ramlibacter]|uniref:TonB-dependent siderophore receptor n=1 Tax=Ramlibacter aquaticus TaxID=2780094 RepID=A0ABR9SKH7_9BURK|nr:MULTISPECIES: TonB-dependent siderophore receptor [Ramlibacter]MBE7942755.1 TonB-dependent siderophore receptor [Ramlibacter aquaticus]
MAFHAPSTRLGRIPGAIALLFAAAAAPAFAQQATLAPVTVTGQVPAPDVAGFGAVPVQELPVSVDVVSNRQIEAVGARRLADLTGFDPSVTDAYDAPGYWDFLAIRGFTLDNRFNYRREGLPINAETTIPLDNKERVEILKGTSGIQAGTSAPGGLVNYVVKRPTDTDLRAVRLEYTSRGSLLGAVDLGGRFGADSAFGYRLNVAQERLRPEVHNLDGERSLVALAMDWRIGRDSLLEAEGEWSRKSQASQVGFSLLGDTLPAVPDPRLNLNNQPWAQPSRFDAATGTLRFTQALSPDWKLVLQAGRQQLRSNDYTAFPFGCSAEGNYDRYCSDGSFDYYDYRSEGERRRQDAASATLRGTLETAGIRHALSLGLLESTVKNRLPDYAYNYVGTGTVDGMTVVPSDPTPAFSGTRLDERSTEISVQDAITWTPRLSTWIGLRHTRLHRESVANDGTGATAYTQGLSTPWAAVSYKLAASTMAYASWGQGVESQVVPNNGAIYANPGAVLPALKSRQVEAGLKGGGQPWTWQLAAFEIHRPVSNIEDCNNTGVACTGAFDGEAVHRGLEAAAGWTQGAWRANASGMWLHARREGSVLQPEVNGQRPVNVPAFIARAELGWKLPGLAGAELVGRASHEGSRTVLPDGSISIPAWTRLDAALRWERRVGEVQTAWTLGVDNLGDRRYWRESPMQFGHVYLYPGAPRTFRIGFSAAI